MVEYVMCEECGKRIYVEDSFGYIQDELVCRSCGCPQGRRW